MKDYVKPEMEYVNFAMENIAAEGAEGGGSVTTSGVNDGND